MIPDPRIDAAGDLARSATSRPIVRSRDPLIKLVYDGSTVIVGSFSSSSPLPPTSFLLEAGYSRTTVYIYMTPFWG